MTIQYNTKNTIQYLDEGRVVLDVVGEDGRPVVSHRLPDDHRVPGVALDPEQGGRVGHVLHYQGGGLGVLVQLGHGLQG